MSRLFKLSLLSLLLAAPVAAQGPVSASRAAEALRAVPVFIPMDARGTPVVATPPGGGQPTVGLFLRKSSATAFVANLRKSNPEVGKKVVIRAASLGNTLRLFQAKQDVGWSYVPDPAELTAARQLLAAEGKPNEVPGVPVYLVKTADGGYLTFTQQGRTVVPGFLGMKEMESFRARYQQSPGAGPTTVEVSTLEVLVQLLNTSAEPLLAELDIVPSGEAVLEARP